METAETVAVAGAESEHSRGSRYDQNQNDDSISSLKENSLLGPRMTKSASWFNSLSRRASRKTPTKKRTYALGSTNLENLAPGATRPRLNNELMVLYQKMCQRYSRSTTRSDWDVSSPDSSGLGDGLKPPDGRGPQRQQTSRSTDCLDLDVVCSGMTRDSGECDVSPRDSPRDTCQGLRQGHMRKYQAVIRLSLNSSQMTLNSSHSDLSTLDLVSVAGEAGEVDTSAVTEASLLGPGDAYYTLDTRRLASKHKKNQHDRMLLYGVKQFNLQPERGLKYLQENGFLENNPDSVAKFLFRQERLSKKQIGKYLGSHLEFNKEVLLHFVRCHEFTQLLLVQALRQFLWSFRLPGEAMQIDRVMDAFAEHYCEQNPNIFDERDTCFILSFSIIMLNTALHNPNAKMKISAEQFIKQNKGINSGKDLAPDMLEAIFRSIKEEPFKIPDETYDDLMYTFFSPEREGWLLKQGGSWKTWKRRWFVLNDRCLYYFQHTAENVPKGIIPLENIRVRPVEDRDGKQFVFEIYSEMAEIIKGCKTDSNGTVVQGNHKYYRLSATNEEDRNEWIRCIQESIRDNPFHKIIADKKAAIRRKSGQRFQPKVINEKVTD